MDPHDTDLASAEACLKRLSLELSQLERGGKANLTLGAQPLARQFAELRGKIEPVLEQIAALKHQNHAGGAPSEPNRDRQWHALKAAIQTYRNAMPLPTDHTNRT